MSSTLSNNTRFLLTEKEAGVGAADAPALFKLRQHFPRPQEHDVAAAVHRELSAILPTIEKGQRIAITGSSRGIVNLALILQETVAALRQRGAEPFVIPGMGSHGGATVEGQTGVLAAAGVTEESLGCPIHATMDVVQIGTTASGFPVYQDRHCVEADGVVVINRVKPHTGFIEQVESGLCKMMVIGMGKQAGASRIHQQALRIPMGQMILDASKIILESARPRILAGLAVVENAYKETAMVSGVRMDSHAELLEQESALLKQAYDLFPRLPFTDLDALIVNKIGKNISGSGMDSNVIGKKPGMTSPRIGAIYVRGLTEATHGNATGIGVADLMPRALLPEIDLNSTYMNGFTAKRLIVGKIPMMAEHDLQALQVLLNFRQDTASDSLRLACIHNTSQLDELWASTALLDEARNHQHIEILSEPEPIIFDENNQFYGEWAGQ